MVLQEGERVERLGNFRVEVIEGGLSEETYGDGKRR